MNPPTIASGNPWIDLVLQIAPLIIALVLNHYNIRVPIPGLPAKPPEVPGLDILLARLRERLAIKLRERLPDPNDTPSVDRLIDDLLK